MHHTHNILPLARQHSDGCRGTYKTRGFRRGLPGTLPGTTEAGHEPAIVGTLFYLPPESFATGLYTHKVSDALYMCAMKYALSTEFTHIERHLELGSDPGAPHARHAPLRRAALLLGTKGEHRTRQH